MIKQLICVSILSSVALQAEGFYAGLNWDKGTGTHELTLDGNTLDSKDNVSMSSVGIHVGYMLSINESVELSYGTLDMDNEDVTRFGVDYIHRFDNDSLFIPYAGIGLAMNNLKGSTVEDGFAGRLRGGVYYEIIPNLEVGGEINYNYISWKTTTDVYGRDWSLSTSYYGIGLNVNYKF